MINMNYKNVLLVMLVLFFGFQINAQEEKEIKVESFDEVRFEGSAQWVLVPADVEKVVIVSKSEDVFDYINVDESSGILTISTTDKNKNVTKLFKSVTIKVYFKSIHSVYLSGVGSVNAKEDILADKFTSTLRGTGDMDITVKCSEFVGYMYGTGGLNVNGKTEEGLVRVEGVGGFDGYELECANMNVTVSGVGGAKVWATEAITATLNGVGSIKYKGDPKTKNLNTNGIGYIKKVDD